MRDYQITCANRVLEEWETNRSTLVVAPTGTGKTHIITEIVRRSLPKRCMIVAHREELIWQARDRLMSVANIESEIEMADLIATTSLFHRMPVVISTLQTLNSGSAKWRTRMGRFDPKDFQVLIVDEAHHATASTYKNVINYFSQNPDLKIVGFTATPDRFDEEALGQMFNTVAFDYEILDAINDGWLCDVEQMMVTVEDLDFSNIRTTAGDLNGADLSAVMEAEKPLHGVAKATLDIVVDNKTIVFCASVKQAEMLSEIFNRHRAGMSDWVCGATPKETRRPMLKKFVEGDLQVVCNCDVLTEGFDNPGVKVVVMAKPTKSRAKYAQMAGRCMRPLPRLVDEPPDAEGRRQAIAQSHKPACLIVDFAGNSGRHHLMTTADILGGNVSDEALKRAAAKAKQLGKPVKMAKLIEEEEEQIEVERKEAQARRLAEEARRAKIMAREVRYKTRVVDPFNAFNLHPARERGWDFGKSLSEKQRQLLARQGIDPNTLDYAQGRQVLNELFRRWGQKLCTLKQANLLKSKYPTLDTKNLSMESATKMITELKNNQWKPIKKNGQQPESEADSSANTTEDSTRSNYGPREFAYDEDTTGMFTP